MSERAIKVMEMADVWPGMYVAEVDSDEWGLGELVDPAAYDESEQDWQHVLVRRGYVDMPTFVLAMHDGTPYTTQWQSSASVWVLVEDGQPVVQDPDE